PPPSRPPTILPDWLLGVRSSGVPCRWAERATRVAEWCSDGGCFHAVGGHGDSSPTLSVPTLPPPLSCARPLWQRFVLAVSKLWTAVVRASAVPENNKNATDEARCLV